jgi:hypothetical protein
MGPCLTGKIATVTSDTGVFVFERRRYGKLRVKRVSPIQ